MIFIKKIILLLVLTVLVAGCVDGGTSISLPNALGWERQELEVEPMEDFSYKQGAYQKENKNIMLFVYNADDDILLKNVIMGKAYDIIEEPEKEGGGIVGDSEVIALKSGDIITLYFNNKNTGYVVSSDSKENLEEFLGSVFGAVFIDI